MCIVRIQASENIADWKRACDRAAALLSGASKEFENLISDEARKRYNSLFMRQLNGARKTMERKVREEEDNFRVPCEICGKPMYFSSNDEEWEEEKKALNEAFKGWCHSECLENRSVNRSKSVPETK